MTGTVRGSLVLLFGLCFIVAASVEIGWTQEVVIRDSVYEQSHGMDAVEVNNLLKKLYPDTTFVEGGSFPEPGGYMIVELETLEGPFVRMGMETVETTGPALAVLVVAAQVGEEDETRYPEIVVLTGSGPALDVVSRLLPSEYVYHADYRMGGGVDYGLTSLPVHDDAGLLGLVYDAETAGDVGGRRLRDEAYYAVAPWDLQPMLGITTEYGEGGYTDARMTEYEWDATYASITVLDEENNGLRSLSVKAYDNHIEKRANEDGQMRMTVDDITEPQVQIFEFKGSEYRSQTPSMFVGFVPTFGYAVMPFAEPPGGGR